ncbi:MAG: YciI family protein [Gemmatimonadaceae bacterium]|jgi:hypothetical protein|nr:YciI family protein [Gemmatimonadaceae bacterium]
MSGTTPHARRAMFLLSVIDDRTNSGTAEEMKAITAFNARLRAERRLVYAGGLTSPEHAHIVDGRTTARTICSGTLHVATEFISGFWIIEAVDQDEALALAAEASRHCNRRVELRALLGDGA